MPAPSTQQFIEIQGIDDGVIILKNGGLRRLLMVNGVNFDLKSEAEQDQIIGVYQDLLNGLDFSLQIFIRSRRLNIEPYLQKLLERYGQETNELLKIQISEYQEFIKTFVSGNAIMDKSFFAVVPYDPVSLPEATKGLFSFFQRKKSAEAAAQARAEAAENFRQNVSQLNQRIDQITLALQQIGLRVVPLNTEETTEVFYELYNPQIKEET